MILKEMAMILEANNIGSLGTDLFIHSMPYDISIGVLLLNRMSGDLIDHELKGIRRGGFQVIVREANYDDTLINSIIPLLTIQGKIINGLDVKYILPKSDPIVYPATDGNNIEYSVNFDAVYAKI